MAGAKREPSSLVQSTMISGRSVSTLFSWRVRITSSAPMTPRMPSKRPPRGWESTCEPDHDRGQGVAPARRGGRRCCPSRRRSPRGKAPSASSRTGPGPSCPRRTGPGAARPPPAWRPILAISSRLARRRLPFTRSLVASKRSSKVVDFLGDSVAARAEFRQHPLPLFRRSWYNRKIVMYRGGLPSAGWLCSRCRRGRRAANRSPGRGPDRKACCSPSWATSWRTT